jgi:hypothetical protein
MGGGAAIGMSAANATDEIRVAAPAARRVFTLRIGFVLLAGEAIRTPHVLNSRTDDASKCLSAT